MAELEKRVEMILARVFDISSDFQSAKKEQVESWDSINHLNLILALEDEFNCRIGVDEIPRLIDYNTIIEVVKKHESH